MSRHKLLTASSQLSCLLFDLSASQFDKLRTKPKWGKDWILFDSADGFLSCSDERCEP
jgi:hypothetical protein